MSLLQKAVWFFRCDICNKEDVKEKIKTEICEICGQKRCTDCMCVLSVSIKGLRHPDHVDYCKSCGEFLDGKWRYFVDSVKIKKEEVSEGENV